MLKQPLFQVDAFTSTLYTGNPAAVCPLEYWLEDTVMQLIARENNLSETAFIVPACQGGNRQGELWCEINQDRVILSGYSQLYLQGEIWITAIQKEITHGA